MPVSLYHLNASMKSFWHLLGGFVHVWCVSSHWRHTPLLDGADMGLFVFPVIKNGHVPQLVGSSYNFVPLMITMTSCYLFHTSAILSSVSAFTKAMRR